MLAIVGLAIGGVSCADGFGSRGDDGGLGCGFAVGVATLPAALSEASGIVRDPRRHDLFWIHNDGGHETLLFGVDTTGAVLTTVRVEGAENRDMEDAAIGRWGEDWCLYLGDIGDNRRRRASVRVDVVPLPDLRAVPTGDPGSDSPEIGQVLTPIASWELEYPDRRRNSESLIVDDARRQLVVITKSRDSGPVVYYLDLDEAEDGDGSPKLLTRVGGIAGPIGRSTAQMVTGADLSPDGSTLALRSYASLFLVPWSGVTAIDTTAVPYSLPLFTALEPQGEGIAWGTDGTVLYLASEGRGGRPPQFSRIRCRGR